MFAGPQVFAMTVYHPTKVIDKPLHVTHLSGLRDLFSQLEWTRNELAQVYLALDAGHTVELVTIPDCTLDSRKAGAEKFRDKELAWTVIYDMGFKNDLWRQFLFALAEELDREVLFYDL